MKWHEKKRDPHELSILQWQSWQTDILMRLKLDKMSQAMREPADKLQKLAQDTRAFEGVLSPDQNTIFDLYWKAQMHQRMGHRPLA